MRRLILIFCMMVCLMVCLGTGSALAQPDASTAFARFAVHDSASMVQVDNDRLQTVLEFVIDERSGELDYGRFTREAKSMLRTYIRFMSGVPVSRLNKDEQLAFWLNLYNARMLMATVDAFEAVTRRSKRASANPYAKPRLKVKSFMSDEDGAVFETALTVEAVELSLEDIRQHILFAHWNSPDVLYGMTCPARQCPQLTAEPFTGPQVQQQLIDARTRFLAAGNVKVKGASARVSEALQNYPAFTDDEVVIAHLQQASSGKLRKELETVTRIEWTGSWRLAGKAPEKGWDPMQSTGTMSRGAGRVVMGGEQ